MHARDRFVQRGLCAILFLLGIGLALPGCGGSGLFDDEEDEDDGGGGSGGDGGGGGSSGGSGKKVTSTVAPLSVGQSTQTVQYTNFFPGLSAKIFRKTATEYRIYFGNSSTQTIHLSFNLTSNSSAATTGRIHISSGETLDVYEPNSNSGTQYLILDQVRYGADSGPYYKPVAGAERAGVQDRVDDDRVLAPPDPAPAR